MRKTKKKTLRKRNASKVPSMNRIGIPLGVALFALLLLIVGISAEPVQAGTSERAAKCATKGDSKTSKSIAKKVVNHAIKQYDLGDLTDDTTQKAARKEVYEFLKWKLGNPSAICAQYVTAGQKHFNKAYADEAAAALVGFNLPNEKAGRATFQLPPEIVDLWVMTEKLKNAGKAYLLQGFLGIPSGLSRQVLNEITEQKAKVIKRLGFNIPKKYDFPTPLLLITIDAKRNPQHARAEFQQAVEEAAKQEQSLTTAPISTTVDAPQSTERLEDDGAEEEAVAEDDATVVKEKAKKTKKKQKKLRF
jgi:hypothetical protein